MRVAVRPQTIPWVQPDVRHSDPRVASLRRGLGLDVEPPPGLTAGRVFAALAMATVVIAGTILLARRYGA